jgi:cell volume regulation protein A
MVFTTENIFLLGSILIFLSIVISKTGYRFGIPTLLLFLFMGMFFGSDGLGLHFDSPKDAQFIGMVSLSIILFSGGMDTKFKDIRPIAVPGVLLSTVGVVLTTVLTGLFIYFLSRFSGFDIHLSLVVSLLLAATMSSTDSASVFNLLRTQKIGLKHRLRPILELESGSNDPMAYMLTIALMEVAVSGASFSFSGLLANLTLQFALGASLGYGCGKLCTWIINHINLPNASLYPVLLLSMVFIIFTITDLLHGNGYLAVYIAGLVVGNNRLSFRKEMTTFMDGLTWLVQIVMFLTLGLLVNPNEMFDVSVVALAIGVFMILVARPASVYLCLLPFRQLSFRALTFLSWVGLRGAVPIIFATYPMIAGVEGSGIMFNIVFFITLLSLSIQGTTISSLARWLKLDMPEEKDGNEFGIELPDELGSQLKEWVMTKEMLEKGNRLSEMDFPERTLVMLIKRGNSYIVPNGQVELQKGDVLLSISN